RVLPVGDSRRVRAPGDLGRPLRSGRTDLAVAGQADRARGCGGPRRRNHMSEGLVPATNMMILIAGPYRSGTGDDPARMAANVAEMERFALPLFRAGHTPIVGEWLALPLVALAGSKRVGDAAFDEIFHPIAERLL